MNYSDGEDLAFVNQLVEHFVGSLAKAHERHEDLFAGFLSGRYVLALSVAGMSLIIDPAPSLLGIADSE